MLCGQKKSLVVDSDMKALVETIDEGLKALGKKRKNTVGDGHCLMWAWAKGFHILKSCGSSLIGRVIVTRMSLCTFPLAKLLKIHVKSIFRRKDL